MRRDVAELAAVAGFTALAIGIGLAGESAPLALRLLFGVPLALLLPGYVITQALFQRAFAPSARLMLSICISFIITVLGAFLLNFTPGGIGNASWAILLGGITLVGCLLAYMRHSNDPDADSAEVDAVMHAPLRKPSPAQLAMFAGAGLALAAAVVIASIGAQYPQTELVNMWIKRSEPTSNTGRIQVGVDNVNSPAVAYRVRVQRGSFVVREWPTLEVPTGTSWVGTFDLTANPPGEGPVEALLYRADNPQQIFRRVMISLMQ